MAGPQVVEAVGTAGTEGQIEVSVASREIEELDPPGEFQIDSEMSC